MVPLISAWNANKILGHLAVRQKPVSLSGLAALEISLRSQTGDRVSPAINVFTLTANVLESFVDFLGLAKN